MSTEDLDQLSSLLDQIRKVRSILPNIMRKLAHAGDSTDSTTLFAEVANDVLAWNEESEKLSTEYNNLLHLINPEVAASQNYTPTSNQPSNHGLGLRNGQQLPQPFMHPPHIQHSPASSGMQSASPGTQNGYSRNVSVNMPDAFDFSQEVDLT